MSTMVPMYGFGGGTGGTGASLTVTAPAGATVTVSKDGKSKTKVADASGVVVFKGLATGDWTVTITDGDQEAQKTVTITADYAAAITFFTATIHVTYPAGSTCTATDGTTTLTAPDTSGTWDCVVPNAGTWEFTAGNAEGEVEIISNNQYEDLKLRYWIFKSGYGAKVPIVTFKQANSSISVNSNEIAFSFTSNYDTYSSFRTQNKIDIEGYSKLCAEYAATSFAGSKGVIIVVSASGFNTGAPYEENGVIDAYAETTNVTQSGYVDLNLSDLPEIVYCGAYSAGKVSIKNLWLEA